MNIEWADDRGGQAELFKCPFVDRMPWHKNFGGGTGPVFHSLDMPLDDDEGELHERGHSAWNNNQYRIMESSAMLTGSEIPTYGYYRQWTKRPSHHPRNFSLIKIYYLSLNSVTEFHRKPIHSLLVSMTYMIHISGVLSPPVMSFAPRGAQVFYG